MVDFIKIEIPPHLQKELLIKLEATGWTTIGKFDRNTGEVKEHPFYATLQGLKITFKSANYIELSGSFHKYFQGGKNFGDFTYSNLLQVIVFLYETLGINPFKCLIRHLEFGVNISPSFITTEFLPHILNYKGTNFNPMSKQQGVSLGVVCERTQLNIKIYCKKTQYGLATEVMRIELKVFKMQYLKPHGVNFLIDLLNPHTWHDFKKQLSRMFAELIITDDSFDLNDLPVAEKELMINWSNPRHLEKLIKKNRKIFEQERRKFRKLIQDRSKDNRQQKVVELILEKANQLLIMDEGTFTKFTDFINLFKNENSYHFYHSINRENWKTDLPALPPIPDLSNKGAGAKNIPSKEFDRQKKEDGKIGKGVIKKAPIQKEVKTEGQIIETPPPRLKEPEKITVPQNWDNLISELQLFFSSIELPTTPVKLNGHTTIVNVAKFVTAHMATVIHNKSNRTFAPYLERLIQLQDLLK